MPDLKDTHVSRGGALSYYPNRRETNDVYLDFQGFHFSLRSKGGGMTEVDIHIGPGDFPQLLEQMTERDPAACLNAMLGEISRRDRYSESSVKKVDRKNNAKEYLHKRAVVEACGEAQSTFVQRLLGEAHGEFTKAKRQKTRQKKEFIWRGLIRLLDRINR